MKVNEEGFYACNEMRIGNSVLIAIDIIFIILWNSN